MNYDYKKFLTIEIPAYLSNLKPIREPEWGKMNPQDMVEHLIMVVTSTTIISQLSPAPPSAFQENLRQMIITSDEPFPHFMENPAYKNGLPPHEFPTLDGAKAKLVSRIQDLFRIYEAKPQALHYSGFFGFLTFSDLQRFHFKHFTHHFEQFGLLK